jgi:hypothetical protein
MLADVDASAGGVAAAQPAAPRAMQPFGEPAQVDALFVAYGQCPKFATENQQWQTIARALAAADDDGKLSTWTVRGLLIQAVAAAKTLEPKRSWPTSWRFEMPTPHHRPSPRMYVGPRAMLRSLRQIRYWRQAGVCRSV